MDPAGGDDDTLVEQPAVWVAGSFGGQVGSRLDVPEKNPSPTSSIASTSSPTTTRTTTDRRCRRAS